MNRTLLVLSTLVALAACKNGDPDTPSGPPTPPDGSVSACFAGNGQPDADADGVTDACDQCVGDDYSGDRDGDGTCDDLDVCPVDALDDSDGDGFCDSLDLCAGDDLEDADGDGSICHDDCDDTDPDAVPGSLWYPDLDGDGFGDAAAAGIVRCMPLAGHTTVPGDCDDTRDGVHPGAIEWCDGLDTDCDPATLEPALAVHEQIDGVWSDRTLEFVNTAVDDPFVFATEQDGFLGMCGADGHYQFDVQHDLQIVAVDTEIRGIVGPSFTVGDPDATALDPAVRLSLTGVDFAGIPDASLVRVDHATVELTDIDAFDLNVSGPELEARLVDAQAADVTLTGVSATALGGRALVARSTTLTVESSVLQGFSHGGDGGVIASVEGSDTTLVGVELRDNQAVNGGAVRSTAGSLTLLDVRMDTNVGGFGGAIQAVDTVLVADSLDLTENTGNEGGAIRLEGGTATFTSLVLEQNQATSGPGGLQVLGATAVVDGATVVGNTTGNGPGGLGVVDGVLRVRAGTFLGNQGTSGGALSVETASSLHLTDVVIRGNAATEGGAIRVDGAVEFDGSCTIAANQGTAFGATSGAIHLGVTGVFHATGCTWGTSDADYNAPRAIVTVTTPVDERPAGEFECDVDGCVLAPDPFVDTDADGVHDAWDRCVGDDYADPDGNGLPCRLETAAVP